MSTKWSHPRGVNLPHTGPDVMIPTSLTAMENKGSVEITFKPTPSGGSLLVILSGYEYLPGTFARAAISLNPNLDWALTLTKLTSNWGGKQTSANRAMVTFWERTPNLSDEVKTLRVRETQGLHA